MNSTLLLSISIPTYKRVHEFSRIIGQLASQLRELDPLDQSRIELAIYDNPSQHTSEKRAIFNSEVFGSCLLSWNQNKINIGADNNICQAYRASCKAEYTWVIGDDEQLCNNAISRVLKTLKSEPSLGLLVLINEDEYPLAKEILNQKRWRSYCDFANAAASVQPHLLIAHSLISCNVVRSSVYNYDLALNEITKVSARWRLPFCFSHMKGIVGGLSDDCTLAVFIDSGPVLNTTNRSPLADQVGSEHKEMIRLYRLYAYWLIHEFGLDSDLVLSNSAMNALLPSSAFLCSVVVTRLCQKLKHLPERVRHRVIHILRSSIP